MKVGYVLQRSADQINLAELVEAMEDGLKLTTCSGEQDDDVHECSVHNLCPIRGPLDEIHRAIFGVLRGITLAEVFHRSSTTTIQPVLSILGHRGMPAADLQEINA